MRLLFFVTGIGLGDSTREHANMEAFLKRDPTTEIVVAGYDNSYEYFKDKFPTVKIRGYRLFGRRMKFNVFSFFARNFLLPFYWVWDTTKLRMLIKKFDPDVIISDFEPSGILLAKSTRKKCIVIFGYDPLGYEELAKKHNVTPIMATENYYLKSIYDKADFVIIQTIRKKRPSLKYNYVHPIIRALPKDLHSETAIMKKLDLKKEPILVMLGGSEFGIKLAVEIDVVAKLYPREQFIFFGARAIRTKSRNVLHYRFKQNIFEYLKVAKGVISLAGQKSLTEAFVFKKPMLIFPIQSHIEQALNAHSLEDIAHVSWKVDSESVAREIYLFLKDLSRLSKKMKKLNVPANGAEEVVNLVYGFLHQ